MPNATLGTVDYRDGGILALPVTFAANVIAPSKSIFDITYVSGDSLQGIDYRLVRENTAYALVFKVPPDRRGSFRVAANGDVLLATGIYENVVATPVTVAYNTIVPRIVDFDIPADYTPGEFFDVRIAYNVRVTGLSDNNVQEVFILEGAANTMGTPTPYKWTGTPPPDSELRDFLQKELPDDLTETDWQQLQSPPASVPTTAENDFDENGFWHGAVNEGQYFLVRWTVQEGTAGIFSMTSRPGILRGPVA